MAGLWLCFVMLATAKRLTSLPVPWVRLTTTMGTAFVGVNAKVYSSSAVLPGLARIMAALLPASMGLPPPMQSTALASGGSAEGRRLVYGVGCGVGSHLVVQGDAYAVLGAGCGDVIPCAGKLVGMPAGHAKDGVDASGLQIGGDVINLGDGSDSKIGRCLCADFLNITLIESSIPHGGLLYGKQIRLSNQTNCSFIHN